MNGNEFLFDVVKDQRERANLAKRHPGGVRATEGPVGAWDRDMLPIPPMCAPTASAVMCRRIAMAFCPDEKLPTKVQVSPPRRGFSFVDPCLAFAVKQRHLKNNHLFVARINVNLQ
jgi:hypothetical protein